MKREQSLRPGTLQEKDPAIEKEGTASSVLGYSNLATGLVYLTLLTIVIITSQENKSKDIFPVSMPSMIMSTWHIVRSS